MFVSELYYEWFDIVALDIHNHKKNEKDLQKIEQGNQFKNDIELKKNSFKDDKKESKNNLKTNSIDEKGKQFADFFNGEIVNLE